MNILARLKRIGILVISHGFGGTGTAPTPPIVTGPCAAGVVEDVGSRGVVGDASMTSAMLPTVSISLFFGDAITAGVVANPQIEGTAIDAC